ncbi:HAD-IIIC family phosphatase [Chromobacterium phragmitis]|uniref:HAD-IIIC family phosphatase n=1 Tax=Chromobacterium phragmitis TaxID=2202141 RepID=A0ABV0IU43_9NEIS
MNHGELLWLPACPEGFRNQCKQVLELSAGWGDALQKLASFRLDTNQLGTLARTLLNLRAQEAVLTPLNQVKLGVISNGTMALLTHPLIASAIRYGINLDVVEPHYGQFVQQALDPESELNLAKPDVVLIALDYRALPISSPVTLGQDAAPIVANFLDQVEQIAANLKKNCGATILVSTLAQPPRSLFGNMDCRQQGSLRWVINEINAQLQSRSNSWDLILDVQMLAESVGTSAWFDNRQWNHGKIPMAPCFFPAYTDYVARVLMAIKGASRKCLVLDLDNTLWGGVIGDDGVEGIVVGNGNSLGEAFQDFQRAALDLRARGVLLAVCSKNDEEVAKGAFERHPDMVLKLEHFSSFIANWDDKASNLRRIASELNIGLNALVFADDNPFERELVRREAPQVAVLEMPQDPSSYRDVLSQAGWFESISFTDEDRNRNAQYSANKQRELLKGQTDLVTYLRSLDMKLHAEGFGAMNRSRVTQLVNKTNQFNLTTPRYTELEIEAFEKSNSGFNAAYRLVDSFGDNGIISVLICESSDEHTWDVNTWLMSCRVLGRQVERAILNHIVSNARAKNISALRGVYIPTDRNMMVKDHYKNLGFTSFHDGAIERWVLAVDSFVPFDVPMETLGAIEVIAEVL